MKFFRNARLIFALAPLSLAAAAQPAPAQAASPSQPSVILPPGAPPLTPAQKQQQQARLARFYGELNTLQHNASLSNAQKQQQFLAMKKSLDQDMLGILNPAQRKAVISQNLNVVKLRQAFLKQHQADITKANTLNASFQKSFTPAQKQKVQDIEAQAREQVQRAQADTKSTPQAKQHTLDSIMRSVHTQEMAVLTPTQQSQMSQIRAIQKRLGQELTTYAKAHGQK